MVDNLRNIVQYQDKGYELKQLINEYIGYTQNYLEYVMYGGRTLAELIQNKE